MSVPSVLSVKIATENQYVAILENDFVLSVEKIKLTAVQCPISSTIHSALMHYAINAINTSILSETIVHNIIKTATHI